MKVTYSKNRGNREARGKIYKSIEQNYRKERSELYQELGLRC